MRSPLRFNARLLDARLPVERPLSVRVLSLSWTLDLGRVGATGATAVPVAVIDGAAGARSLTPVIDPFAVVAAVGGALTIGRFARRRRLANSRSL